VGKALVMLDTEHIKEYVFGTDRLKEIRGASSLLDYLNRHIMSWLGCDRFGAKKIYTNGGDGLFVVDEEKADDFGKMVQFVCHEKSGGTVLISYEKQIIPDEVWADVCLMDCNLENELKLLQYRLRQAKNTSPSLIALPSHAFMRPCDACGIEYTTYRGTKHGPYDNNNNEDDDAEERDRFFCDSCHNKYLRDKEVKNAIRETVKKVKSKGKIEPQEGYLWDRVIDLLSRPLLSQREYNFPNESLARRPKDFNEFREFSGPKGYMGLIYADGNGMSKAFMNLTTLREGKGLAEIIDGSVYEATAIAIREHLPITQPENIFPFDILLIGGDDIIIVTPAMKAPDVALTIAREFERLTKEKDPKGKGYTLSVGVVLAPIKYPFGLLQDLAEGALKFAKKRSLSGESRINFVTVAGSISQNFDKVYQSLSQIRTKDDLDDTPEFYATLRPYNIEQFNRLLDAIRHGHELGLGRTKLHQLREAILKRNLTTSVNDALAVLRNWRKDQREYVVNYVYTLATQHQEHSRKPDDPSTWFPRVTFPWFANDRKDAYHTTLLDFIELYDFVAGEEVEGRADEA